MMPAYRNMDSYPFQRNQTPFPYYNYHPGFETVPPQMRMDSTKPPFPYEHPWPYAGNFGHSTPMHFCCGHNNFPGCYSYRPYPHVPAPSPMYYPGGYSSYGEPFFGPYSPQSCHTMEVPRYEYEKYVPKEHHCCGCPNHVCNNKEGNNVKIEEYKDDVVKKDKDGIIPVHLGNYPYYGDRQLKKSTAHDKKATSPKNLDACGQPPQEPKVLGNGWLPFDMKGAPNMVHNGEGIRSQNREADNHIRESEDSRMDQKKQSGEHKRSEFPFPIMWWPFFNKPEEDGKTSNQKRNSTPECVEEVPKSHTLKSVPVKSSVHEGVAKNPCSNGVEFTDSRASVDDTGKVANQRTIPVKQMEKSAYEGSEKREMEVPMNNMKDNVMKEDSHSNSKRGSTFPRNGSKLPPVCLRVDPLPRKRNGNGNGSSRSPSRPASKEHSHSKPMASETNKAPSSGMNEKAKPDPNLNSQNAPNKVRTIQVTENKTDENKGNECQSQTNMPSGVSTLTRESYTNDRSEDKKEEKRTENMTGEAMESSVKDTRKQTNGGSKKEGKVLLDADAAVLIQAAFRGYQVRRWQPLKKLKQIAEISKEVTDVRSRIQAFEDSSDLQNNEKEKIATGETIMRLLLKLDTIQGLHPSLRETRKSLARKLVTFQEKLDSMMTKKPQQKMQEFDVQKPTEVPPLNEEYHQEQQEEKVGEPEHSSKDNSEDSHDTSEEHHDQFCMNDGNSNTSEEHHDHAPNEGMKPNVLPNVLVNEESSQMVTVSALDSTDNLCETDKTAVKCDAKLDGKDTQQVEKLDMKTLKELPVGVLDEDIIDIGSENQPKDGLDFDSQAMMELPVGVLDEDIDIGSEDQPKDGLDLDIQAMMELPVGVLDEDTVTSDFRKVDETNISKLEAQAENDVFIEELPVGLLDEDTINSEILPVVGVSERPESTTNDNAKETQAELPLPLLEEQKEVQFCGELADSWVKIEFQNEDELKGDAPEESKECLATQVTSHDQGNEEPLLEANGETNIMPEPVEYVKESEEKFGQQETQVDGYSETEEPAVVEHGEGLKGDVSLLEENEKLRKLMRELLEAGNEQLSVISNLTGRVKDLEKKLERTRSNRSKRLRTKRNRTATPKCLATVF